MKSFAPILAVLAALCLEPAAAHYRFTSLIAGGVTTNAFQYVRENNIHNSPVFSGNGGSIDLRCNSGGGSGANTQTYPVSAGATIGFKMDQAVYHAGPLLVYISKAPSTAATYDGSGQWTKIYEIAPSFNGNGPVWNTENKDSFTFSLPASLAAGEYLVRIEQIALHGMPAQHYLSCAQIKVSGSGTANPPGQGTFPGIYTGNDAGINLNIYYPVLTSYKMPGGAVWRG